MEGDTVQVTFELVNNKRIPVTMGEDGLVVSQYRLKF